LIDPTGQGATNPIMPAPAKEWPAASPRALPTAGHTSTDARTAHHSTGPSGVRLDLLRLPHRLPNGAGLKALRPLRDRAPREPWRRRLRRHVCLDAKKPQPPLTDTLAFRHSWIERRVSGRATA